MTDAEELTIVPIVTGTVPVVRMLNVLRAADLIVDDPLAIPMMFVGCRVVLSTSVPGSVIAATDWLCPRLARVWRTWSLDVPLVLAVERGVPEGRQRFVVPERVSNVEEALVSLSEFAPSNGAGSYLRDAGVRRWVPDDDDPAGSGGASYPAGRPSRYVRRG